LTQFLISVEVSIGVSCLKESDRGESCRRRPMITGFELYARVQCPSFGRLAFSDLSFRVNLKKMFSGNVVGLFDTH